jgi:hypothetical protein
MLTYARLDSLEIVGYSDSDFAGCLDTDRSTSGYVFKLACMMYGYVVRQYHTPTGRGIQKPNKQTCMLHDEGKLYPNKLLSILRAQQKPCVSRFVGVSKQQPMRISRECITWQRRISLLGTLPIQTNHHLQAQGDELKRPPPGCHC